MECQMRYGFSGATIFPHLKSDIFDFSLSMILHTAHTQSIVHNFIISTFSIVSTSISDLLFIILHRASKMRNNEKNHSHFAIYNNNTFFIKLNNIMEKMMRGSGSKIRMNERSRMFCHSTIQFDVAAKS